MFRQIVFNISRFRNLITSCNRGVASITARSNFVNKFRCSSGVLTDCRVCHRPALQDYSLTKKQFCSIAPEITSFNIQDADDFSQRVLKSHIPVLVDFHADWCQPCKLLAPKIETLVAKKADKVSIAKVNIDNMTDLAMEYDVTAVPTVIAVKNGKVIDKFIGLLDDDQLEAFINKLIY